MLKRKRCQLSCYISFLPGFYEYLFGTEGTFYYSTDPVNTMLDIARGNVKVVGKTDTRLPLTFKIGDIEAEHSVSSGELKYDYCIDFVIASVDCVRVA